MTSFDSGTPRADSPASPARSETSQRRRQSTKHPTRPNCATAALRPGCRSIPAAKFRHSAELYGATKAALNSPPNKLRTQHRAHQPCNKGCPMSTNGDRKSTGSNFGCGISTFRFPLSTFSARSHSFSQSSSDGMVTSACIWKTPKPSRRQAHRSRPPALASLGRFPRRHFQPISLLPRPKKHSQSISG